MRPQTVDALIARIQSIEGEVGALQFTVAGEALSGNQRQYLDRCFDLLHMELSAVRSYIADLVDP